MGNAGRPAPVTSVRILDAADRECPPGEIRDHLLRGDGAPARVQYWPPERRPPSFAPIDSALVSSSGPALSRGMSAAGVRHVDGGP